MDFSKIRPDSLVGKALRLPLRFIPPSTTVPVLHGPNRGHRWIVGSGVHGYWLGGYEFKTQLYLQQATRLGSVLYDVGANVGFYTLLASRLVGQTGHVYAFEPLPANLFYLKAHIRLNSIKNCTIFETAISNQLGTAKFAVAHSRAMGRLHECSTNAIAVKTMTLDSLFDSRDFRPPDVIKIDIEGAEFAALQGAQRILTEVKPILLVATHSNILFTQCVQHLSSLGYTVQRTNDGLIAV